MKNLQPRQPETRGRNPKRGEIADGHIHIRTTMARKNAYVRAAKPQKLTDWIFENLDKAAQYESPETKLTVAAVIACGDRPRVRPVPPPSMRVVLPEMSKNPWSGCD